MIWVTDHQGNLTYVGQQWHHLTGQETSAALGSGWHDSLYPDDRALVIDSFAEACRHQTEFMLLFRLQRTDGSHIWVLGGASPSFTPLTEDFVGFLGVLSEYGEDAQGLTAKADVGTFKPGRPTGDFAPLSKLDIAADYLIAARAVTVEYGAEVANAIDDALHALGQALQREQNSVRPPGEYH
ncbi:PAS domain-containing protein [Methylobacterium sp. Leaf456]|uniref:PAS domain-containing protein n=1 Tax=Methylobacterium sp. Leaf456 TaxID=1736382 RepID=UPI000B120B59|nr:PAS domain-containing protein [Methylobacterium sp. Leaf456]